jgi:hypothetical protein
MAMKADGVYREVIGQIKFTKNCFESARFRDGPDYIAAQTGK